MRERWEQCWEGEERDGKCGERGNRRNGKGQGSREQEVQEREKVREMNGMERRGEKRGKVRGRRQEEGRGVRRAKERR